MRRDLFRVHHIGKASDQGKRKKKSQNRKDQRENESSLHQQIDDLIIDIIKTIGITTSR